MNFDSFVWYQQLSKFNETNVITIYMDEGVGKFLKGTYMIDCMPVREKKCTYRIDTQSLGL